MGKLKLKKRLVLKKKPSVNLVSNDDTPPRPKMIRFYEFVDSFRLNNNIQQVVGCIREWYEKVFDEFPPLDKYPLELIKTKIQYELVSRDHEEAGIPLPPQVLKNYEASRDFNLDGFTGNMKTLIQISINNEGGEVQMGKVTKVAKSQKKKETKAKARAAKASAETVTQTYERLFKENFKKKFKDARLAELVCKAHPNKKTYMDKDIRSVRSLFNCGKLTTQKGIAPKTKSVSFDKPSDKDVAAPKSASKAKPKPKAKPAPKAKKKKTKPVAKKKLVLKKKK